PLPLGPALLALASPLAARRLQELLQLVHPPPQRGVLRAQLLQLAGGLGVGGSWRSAARGGPLLGFPPPLLALPAQGGVLAEQVQNGGVRGVAGVALAAGRGEAVAVDAVAAVVVVGTRTDHAGCSPEGGTLPCSVVCSAGACAPAGEGL